MLKDKIRREGLLRYCENLPFPVVVVDSDYNVVTVNRRAVQKFGDVERGTKCYELTHNFNKPCWEEGGKVNCPVHRLKHGGKPYSYHEHSNGDFHLLIASHLEENLFMEIYLDSYVVDLIKELKFLAETDSLTGLYNRRKLEQLLNEEVQRANRYLTPLSVLFVDIDNFKQLNDTYGHSKGDEVLVKVARVIKEQLRATDFVGRYGGEEFLSILPHTEPQNAVNLAERIRKAIDETDFGVPHVSVSIGITGLKHGESPKDLFARVDRAMYFAKRRGKNRVELI